MADQGSGFWQRVLKVVVGSLQGVGWKSIAKHEGSQLGSLEKIGKKGAAPLDASTVGELPEQGVAI